MEALFDISERFKQLTNSLETEQKYYENLSKSNYVFSACIVLKHEKNTYNNILLREKKA